MKRGERRYYLQTLGCPKNVVDSEGMEELLLGADFCPTDDPRRADVLIVNTCGFLQAAKEESLSALARLAAGKRKGQLLVAAGCLAQREGAAIGREVPNVDGIIGTRSWPDLLTFLRRLEGKRRAEPLFHLLEEGLAPVERVMLDRRRQTGRASAYLKISDGCSAPCAFCTIPSFKGPLRSRPRQYLLDEAHRLAESGVREIILIAQDTTAYGRDRGERDGLPALLEELVEATPGVAWLRLMYTYPGHATERLIEVMARHGKILPYIDMPLQHAHPGTLRRMRRPHNVARVLRWIERYREALAGAVLRTTFIVGYPGETETEFQSLLDFMATVQFDRVGIFRFSPEPGTPAALLPGQVPEAVKAERWERAMALQRGISLARNRMLLGKRIEVLVEGTGDGICVARSYRDAPEIDGYVLIHKEMPVGGFVPVVVTGAMEYDLLAMPAEAC